MGSLPSLRLSGRKVWSRIRQGGLDGLGAGLRVIDGLQLDFDLDGLARFDGIVRPRKRGGLAQALVAEAQRAAAAGSQAERKAQLARVLDAVAALAEAHGIREAELSALRVQRGSRSQTVQGLRQQLQERASGVVAQMRFHGRTPGAPGTPGTPRTVSLGARTAGSAGATRTRRAMHVAAVSAVAREAASAVAGRAGQDARAGTRMSRGGAPAASRSFSLRIGPARVGVPGASVPMRLVAASLLHLPRLHRQLMTVRHAADFARSTLQLARAPARPLAAQNVVAAAVLLASGRSGLQVTYRIASAGAQLWLRRYVLPRVMRYVAGVTVSREVLLARPLPPLR